MEDPEPGFGKKILNFFITEPTENQPDGKSEAPKAKESTQVINNAKPVNTNPVATAQIDKKFVDHFVKLLENSNIPGPDYFEYKQVLRNMETLQLSEEKLYMAAWASFMAMGGIKDKAVLDTSAEKYLKILENDRQSFHKDVEKAIEERVGSLKKELLSLEEANKKNAEEISRLQQKIEEGKARMGQISSDMADQTTKITQNKDGYDATYLTFTDQIREDIIKINKYLDKQ